MKKQNRKFGATLGTITAVAMLSGCAANMNIPGSNPLRQTSYVQQNYKGHAFEVGSVTLANPKMDKPAWDHPLPGKYYLKLIRAELLAAFQHYHLGDGTKPAYKVNVAVKDWHFTSGGFDTWTVGHLYADTSVENPQTGQSTPPFQVKVWDAGGYRWAYWSAPSWDYCRRLPVGLGVFVAKDMKRLQEGKSLDDFSNSYDGLWNADMDQFRGVITPGNSLSQQQIEQITGLSKEQLEDYAKKAGS
ncbi:hypothetical protein [Candidatus Igneacidithiobacillus taiwanensis]|uniref:hypothetical protein n=1 Tax=Candidatus Igneacidithiobacillus taiwanensis TaxID=1945924 RepID=UPI00289B12A8|nr:hypothetical protein [Candidatus Igneacidithiobacillus taiwanensis]